MFDTMFLNISILADSVAQCFYPLNLYYQHKVKKIKYVSFLYSKMQQKNNSLLKQLRMINLPGRLYADHL